MSECFGWTVEAHLPGPPDRILVRARKGLGPPVLIEATVPGAGWRARAALRREARTSDVVDVIDRRGQTAVVRPFEPFGYTSSRSRSSSVSRRTTSRASPSRTKTTGGRGTLL